ncbi:hypothetical protein L6452_36717 [Arctium lappa]|uniref:Uncharacterized protein n=1 Tax=Arctium lappa TaxID=4217 RepID=A0ACB8YAN8_ARCLA|nr:hypothetical protein L6452_36717 [Arctium lappa]
MWATATLPSRLWPFATTTGNRGPFTVSASARARYSRPRKNIKFDYDDEDEEKDEERDNQDTWEQQEIGDSPKISGSVVLLALQKATAQKKKKKTTKIMKKQDEEDKQGDATCSDYRDVKPLCIKSDWKDRLDELETQLHQLIHHNT